jgi:hypothetical protein
MLPSCRVILSYSPDNIVVPCYPTQIYFEYINNSLKIKIVEDIKLQKLFIKNKLEIKN